MRPFGAGAAAVTSVVLAAGTARAHVDYVTDSDRSMDPIRFLLDVFSDPVNVLLVLGGGTVVLVAVAGYVARRPARYDVAVFREAMSDYATFLPWLLRLGVGLPLVGAGFAGYFFNPAVPPVIPFVVAPSRLFQLALGMSLLFGLATRLAALLGLVVYLSSLPIFPDLLLSGEFVSGFIAIVLLGAGQPSADDVLERIAYVEDAIYNRLPPIHRVGDWLERQLEPHMRYAPTIIRVGMGTTFVFLGLTQKLLDPGPALAVVDAYDLTAIVPVDAGLWVVGVGLTEVALGLLLIVGLVTRGVAMVGLSVFTLTLFALPDDPVLAHVTAFALLSALLITGSGPLAVDRWIQEDIELSASSDEPSNPQ